MSTHQPANDDVGFGKPPKHTQFKKGQSGNPRGRPKGSRNLNRFFADLLDEPVAEHMAMSNLEGYVRSYIKKAIAGHTPSFRKFLERADKAKLFAPDESAPKGGILRVKLDLATFKKETERMRAEHNDILARARRGELKELESTNNGTNIW